MDIERLRQGAKSFAQQRALDIETELQVRAANEVATSGIVSRIATVRSAELQVQADYYDSLRPELEIQAIAEHRERFKPLQAMLDALGDPFKEIRDAYLPGSRIGVLDGYLGPKHYFREYQAVGNTLYSSGERRLLGMVAVGIETENDPIYRIELRHDYVKDGGEILTPTVDMEYLTDVRGLFSVYEDNFYFHASIAHKQRGVLSSIKFEPDFEGRLMVAEDKWGLVDNPAEDAFQKILAKVELHDALVARGLPRNL